MGIPLAVVVHRPRERGWTGTGIAITVRYARIRIRRSVGDRFTVTLGRSRERGERARCREMTAAVMTRSPRRSWLFGE